MPRVIAERRDGRAHARETLEAIARGAATGSIPDYQLAAWLMAAYFRPLGRDETAWLTRAMADSGARIDLSSIPRPWVDKHSTGGVGDKTTLVLLPLLAACGLTTVKMSGRGLGITGGTIDKLACVPGFRTDLSPEELVGQAGRVGIALGGQTAALAPADKALYALRDVTATVDSVPLIVSSILSKKLAGGAETVVIDVKCGAGAFMPDLAAARSLAEMLVEVGALLGLSVRCAITDMDQPLGRTVGNALEVVEAIQTLLGAKGRFRDLCLQLAGLALHACGAATNREAGVERADMAMVDGAAAGRCQAWFAAQGARGDLAAIAADLPRAPVVREVLAPCAGWVARLDARKVGEVVLSLGGGRRRKDDPIDPAVGVECLVAVADAVADGQPVMRVHASTGSQADEAEGALAAAITLSPDPVPPNPLIIEVIG